MEKTTAHCCASPARASLRGSSRSTRFAGPLQMVLGACVLLVLASAAGCCLMTGPVASPDDLRKMFTKGDRVGVLPPRACAPRVTPHPEVAEQEALAAKDLAGRIIRTLNAAGCKVILVKGAGSRPPSSRSGVRALAAKMAVDYLIESETHLIIRQGQRAREKITLHVYSAKSGKRVRRMRWLREPLKIREDDPDSKSTPAR